MGGAAFYPDLLDKIRLAGCYQDYFVSGERRDLASSIKKLINEGYIDMYFSGV